jgi:ferredoxin-NADP reductase
MSEFLKVEDVEWHSDDIYELRLLRNGISFSPGDCFALHGADEKVSRPYSCASGVDEDVLRFVIRRMPGGAVSPYLAERAPGERVRVSPPFGWFRPGAPRGGGACVFIATGTGIAPFLSHFRSRPADPPLQCLYGVRTGADAVDLEWLRTLCDLKLCVSREVCEGAHRGRVTDVLDDMPVAHDIHYYLCGLDTMIDEVSSWLEKKDVPITQIHRECFFNASYST